MQLHSAKKLIRQTPAAAHVCITATGHLFVIAECIKLQFLIETGSNLCVFRLKLFPQSRERVDYDLRAGNSETIPT
jgi:hypothetical protein